LPWCCDWGCCSKDKHSKSLRFDHISWHSHLYYCLSEAYSYRYFQASVCNKVSVLWFIPNKSVFHCVLLKTTQRAFQKYVVKIANIGTGVNCARNYIFFYSKSLLTTILLFNFKFKICGFFKNFILLINTSFQLEYFDYRYH
jgi:hypothetical protein